MTRSRRYYSERKSPGAPRKDAQASPPIWYGLILTFLIAVVSWFLGKQFPIIGGPVIGIVLGMLIGNVVGQPPVVQPGVKFASKKILQWAIILLGGGLSLQQVWYTGVDSLAVMLVTLLSAFAAAFLLGKVMGVSGKMTSLIGVGTAICGGSAIAAVSPIIAADDTEIAYSISTIFFFNVIAVLIFPPLGHLLGMTAQSFGLWAGTAINDTSSVVAAGYAFSQAAGEYATIVKLTRTTMIIPVAGLFALGMTLKSQRDSRGSNYRLAKIFPWFILWFLVASLLHTVGIISPELGSMLTKTGKFMIIIALAGVGLGANGRKMLSAGVKPLILGFLVWITVAVTSLIVQSMTGQF